MTTIYYEEFTVNDMAMILAKTEAGICYWGVNQNFYDGLHRAFPGCSCVNIAEGFEAEKADIMAYFYGRIVLFDWIYDLVGTPFQIEVWQQLRQIGYGETVSYQSVADAIGRPRSVRAVANAIGRNKIMVAYPCHRVIGKDGKLHGFGGGLPLKKRLLDLEKT